MEHLIYQVIPHNHGLQWLCHSVGFYTKGKSALRPSVVGNCTVHTGYKAESNARLEAMRLNGLC